MSELIEVEREKENLRYMRQTISYMIKYIDEVSERKCDLVDELEFKIRGLKHKFGPKQFEILFNEEEI